MNQENHSVENSQYSSVLASLTQENESCVDGSLHTHTLEADGNFTSELVGMDELTIVTSNGQVTGRLASRILSGEINSLSSSKSLDLMPEELLQQSCNIGQQQLSFKENSMLTQPKTNKWKELNQLDGRSSVDKKHNIIYQNIEEVNNSQVLSYCENSEINSAFNIPVNKLPLQSTNNTAVEQPNIGPSSCFICGQVLVDVAEKFSYMKSQKLFSMKIPLLQLLGEIINQTVITNTESIDLCPKCSELMNEVDITYKHLNDLKEEITKLFSINNRPKLTFHILPKPSLIPKNYLLKKPVDINLSELACSRPRRGRAKNRIKNKTRKTEKTQENERPKQFKRKGGRPRKPFQCHICKRKFHTQSLSEKHLMKEHYITSEASNSPLRCSSSTTEPSKNLKSHSGLEVKEERLDDEKDNIGKSQNIDAEKGESLLSLIQHSTLQHSTSMSALPKIADVEMGQTGNFSTMRPIQPKPQTLVQTAVDGSLMFFMNPTTVEDPPTLIKVSPGYLNLKTESHTCDLCQKTFLDDKGYKMHKIAAHGVRKRKSDFEGNSNGSCLNDEKKDSIHKIWQCGHCDIIFSSKKLLSEHKKSSHENNFKVLSKDTKKEKIYSCDNCEQIFPYKYKMESHRESHLPFNQVGPHEFVCCLCGLKVASKAALKIHLHRFHSKEDETKDFLCAECGYMTGTKKAFSDHLRIHNDNPGQKKECHLCRKEMLPSSYKIHMLRIHGEAKYPCDTCGQRFTVRSDLMRHLNTIHSTLRPYDCGLCGEKFVTSEALRYHRNKVHSTVFHFCEVCGKNYKWKGELRAHMNRCHNEPRTRHVCSVCPKSYADRRRLYYHMANKHNTPKNDTDSFIRKQCPQTEAREISDIVSSDFEPQGTMIASQSQAVMAPMQCPSTHCEVELVAGEGNLGSLQGYDPNQQTTLTTLHSQMPVSHPDVSSINHYHNSQMQVSEAHDILPQPLGPSLVRLQSKEELTHQDVQPIYLVSDMHMTLSEKPVATS